MKMNMTMHMGEYFFFSTHVKHFLFENLHFDGPAGVAGACAIIFVLTILIEGTKALKLYVSLRLKQNPLTYGRTDVSINQDRSPLFSALMIPSSIEAIKKQRIRNLISGYVLHTFNLLLGYLLMLAIMSYDAYIFITVIAGSGIGYFIFGYVNALTRTKFAKLSPEYERYDSQTVLTNSDSPSRSIRQV